MKKGIRDKKTIFLGFEILNSNYKPSNLSCLRSTNSKANINNGNIFPNKVN